MKNLCPSAMLALFLPGSSLVDVLLREAIAIVLVTFSATVHMLIDLQLS